MVVSRRRRPVARAAGPLALLLAVGLLAPSPGWPAGEGRAIPVARAGDGSPRVGAQEDPVAAAIDIAQQRHADGAAARVAIGRVDAFPDNLAATALAGGDGALLLTDGGDEELLRPEVRDEVIRLLGGPPSSPCPGPEAPVRVMLVGGPAAVSLHVHQALLDDGWCVQRLGGDSRVQTAIRIAEVLDDASTTVLLARDDDWADAAAAGGWAALTRSRILVTPTTALHPDVAAALHDFAPTEIVLLGGAAALSDAVASAAAAIAPVRRIAGTSRDATAAAISRELWAAPLVQGLVLADGYSADAWPWLFAAASLAAAEGRPVLYTAPTGVPPATAAILGAQDPDLLLVGPPGRVPDPAEPPTTADLSAAAIDLLTVAVLDSPLALVPRPGVAELWVAERAGRIRSIGPGGVRTVLDIADTVSTAGERGLLGIAFDAGGSRIYTSSTDNGGDSVLEEFAIAEHIVDRRSRRLLLRVDQPASNHNGGDVHVGPDGYLWWGLGDGGGSGDRFGNGQRPDTLLSTLVRIDPDGGDPYGIPPGNPVESDSRFAPEVWAFGLRNPWRFSFDGQTGDLYIADVGQGRVEEIDWLAAGTGAGSNFGWSVFEGDLPFRGTSLDGHVGPIVTETHAQGNCSITGGVVYRGRALPELHGAYLYTDLCRSSIRAIVVTDGVVTQQADLGVGVGSPVGFGVDHDGEVYVLSLGGTVAKVVPQ